MYLDKSYLLEDNNTQDCEFNVLKNFYKSTLNQKKILKVRKLKCLDDYFD